MNLELKSFLERNKLKTDFISVSKLYNNVCSSIKYKGTIKQYNDLLKQLKRIKIFK